MNELVRVRIEVRVRQWAEMIRCRNESGLSVSDWCEQKRAQIYTALLRQQKQTGLMCSDTLSCCSQFCEAW